MPRSSSQRNPGRQTRGRSKNRASSRTGSGDGTTGGTVPRHKPVTRQGSATISGGIIPSGRNRKLLLKQEGNLRTPMHAGMKRDRIIPPSRAGITGAAGPQERSSKNGPMIFTANNFLFRFFFELFVSGSSLLIRAGRVYLPPSQSAPRYSPCPEH